MIQSESGLRQVWQHLSVGLGPEGQASLVLRLTVLLVMLHGSTSVYVDVLLRMIAGLMLVVPKLDRQRGLWLVLVIAMTAGNGYNWFSIDNHKYLILYWALACTMSLSVTKAAEWLGDVARWITGLVFGLAALWKIVAGQFFDGSFFYYTFLTDPRLTRISAWLIDRPLEEVSSIRDAVIFMGNAGMVDVKVSTYVSPALVALALGLSWITIVFEGTVAIAHLGSGRLSYLARHFGIMGFVAATYFLLPVFPFGLTLCILGIAQCQPSDQLMKARYLLVVGVLHLTLIPWKVLLLPFL